MSLHTPDMIFSLFFLLALILVARFKKQISSVDLASYRYLSGGIAILLLLSMARVYGNLGFFKNIPFLSEPLFFQLISWIGVITGITFIISGVSSWLPLAQNFKKDNVEKIRQLDFIKKIEQLVNFESRLDKILETALDYMVEHFRLKRGLAFKYSPARPKLYPVSSKGEPVRDENKLYDIEFNPESWGHYLDGDKLENTSILTGLVEAAGQPDVILPVLVNNRPVSFFTLWCNSDGPCDREERLNLKIAADIIARKIQAQYSTLRQDFSQKCEELNTNLRTSVTTERTLKENLGTIYKILKSQLPADYLSLVMVSHSTSKLHRFSIAENETVLEEKNVNLFGNNFITQKILETRQVQIINDLSRVDCIDLETIFKNSRIKSLLAVPVSDGRRVEGVFMVGVGEVNRYRRSHIELLNYSLPVLTDLVGEEKNREQLAIRERRIILINKFVNDIGQFESIQSLFEKAVAVIYNELKTTLVRISTVENRNETLKPRMFRVQPSVTDYTPSHNQMIVSLMPYHQSVIKSGRQVMVNQLANGEKMSNTEARMVLSSDLKTALLVPIKLKERVFAILTLAERRSWERFHYNHLDVLFVNSIALALSMALQLSAARRRVTNNQVRRNGLQRSKNDVMIESGLKTRVKSALTGIMGSVEILKSQSHIDNLGQTRYLDIIDRSAQKINECFREDTISV